MTNACGRRDKEPGTTRHAGAHRAYECMKCTDTRLLTRRRAMLGMLAAAVARAPRGSEFIEVARGLFIRSGVDEDANSANGGAIANIGFIIGTDCVATLDAGGSLEDGEALRAAIRARTSLPIRYVILSHAHPDHVFGAPAFVRDHPQFVGHAKLPTALALRGEYYRARLESELGKARAGGVVTPTLLVEGTRSLDLGRRVLALTAHPK